MEILNTQNLPKIIKNEIAYPKLRQKEAISERQKITARIISILGIKFNSDDEKRISVAEFGTMLKQVSLTAPELLEAYRMAIMQKFDYKVYPSLSVIQLGEIVNLYENFKKNNAERDRVLKSLNAPKEKTLSKEQEKQISLEFAEMVFAELQEFGFSDKVSFLYEKLKNKGVFDDWTMEQKKELGKKVAKKLIRDKKEAIKLGEIGRKVLKEIKLNEIKFNTEVEQKCRCILVSEYLQKLNFNELLKEIE